MMQAAEILKALLSWPVAAVIIAVCFKPEIIALVTKAIGRKLKVTVPGIGTLEMDAAEQQQQAAELVKARTSPDSIELKEIPGLVRTAAIAKLERELHSLLGQVTADPIDVLVRNLAQARLEARFGYIYAGIFGSQIKGLIELGARRAVSSDEAYGFYVEYEKQFPEVYNGYGFPGWLGFMIKHSLIVQNGTQVAISDFGDDFLKWLKATQLTINKPW